MIQQMTEAGFINITKHEFKFPIGPWPKDKRMRQAGAFGLVNLLEGIQGLSMKVFTGLLGWKVEDMEMLLAECREEIKKKSVHSYWPM